jgi:signal transduction histidine kinase
VVEDDGAGFDESVVQLTSTGYGLVSMRDRAHALPGSLDIATTPGEGTTVQVVW